MHSMGEFRRRHFSLLLVSLLAPPFPAQLTRPGCALSGAEARVSASSCVHLVLANGASGSYVRDAMTGRVLARLMRAGSDGPVLAKHLI